MNEAATKNDIALLREDMLKGFASVDERFEKYSTLMMDGFAHLNMKIEGVEERLIIRIDGVESRLDNKIDNLERKMDRRFDMVIVRLDDQDARKVSRPEFMALNGRVEALENSPSAA